MNKEELVFFLNLNLELSQWKKKHVRLWSDLDGQTITSKSVNVSEKIINIVDKKIMLFIWNG